jgi:ribosomal-protein-alanine N-acetyltransferase
MLNDPAFVANVGDRGVRTDSDAAGYMRDRLIPSYTRHGFGMWVVELRSTGDIIGNCGLLKRDTLDGVDIGFAFLERYRGYGYALEAALATLEFGWDTAQLDRVLAIVAPHNTRSIALLTKLGLKFEKMIRLTLDSPEIELYAIDRPKTADL